MIITIAVGVTGFCVGVLIGFHIGHEDLAPPSNREPE